MSKLNHLSNSELINHLIDNTDPIISLLVNRLEVEDDSEYTINSLVDEKNDLEGVIEIYVDRLSDSQDKVIELKQEINRLKNEHYNTILNLKIYNKEDI